MQRSALLYDCTCGLYFRGFTDCSYGPQWADVGCLGNRVLLQVRATMVAAQAMTRGEAVGWSRALNESSTIVI